MQIAPIGAVEAALANLSAGTALQQQVATAAAAAQPGSAVASQVKEKQEIGKVRTVEKGEEVSSAAGQQVAQAGAPAQAPATSENRSREAVAPMTERQLFDYLMEIERSGGGSIKGPSELFDSALKSIDTTIRQVQEVLGGAHRQVTAPEGSTSGRQAGEAPDLAQSGEAPNPDGNDPSKLLERSISVMWAAANLEVVLSGVTAASSSVGTLIKQQ